MKVYNVIECYGHREEDIGVTTFFDEKKADKWFRAAVRNMVEGMDDAEVWVGVAAGRWFFEHESGFIMVSEQEVRLPRKKKAK